MNHKQIISQIAQQTGFSESAVTHIWMALENSGGSMAQFNHPELGGMGQWQSGGMLMIGDMFNNQLKAQVATLCQAVQQQFLAHGPLSPPQTKPAQSASRAWWPADYGQPNATGSQNEMRYAYFSHKNRLVVEISGKQTIYDTDTHHITGFSQQNGAWRFQSQLGSFGLADLDRVDE